jgi:hypothetical protein
MPGQSKFPAGFGCDPTLLSGGGPPIGRLNPRLNEVTQTGLVRAPLRLDAGVPLPASRMPTRRLVEIESQHAQSPRGRSLSTLWTSAALGAALASSLYFLNYF